ncbi:MAG: HAD-IA family hydrolase [Cyanobacteria bacterium M_DeepCast_100m_m1_067]|nr:HAD-IA family hydrolase [Cyanobacteria bacterium M_DeepCast_100m_m1_067]
MALQALLWDVDGTLAETERDGHRLAFNRAFAELGVPLHWDGERYGELLAISGGRERIAAALAELQGAPPEAALVADLQARKQRHYAALVAAGELQLRPGVAELIGMVHAAGLPQGIVTTSGRMAVAALAEHLLGPLAACFSVWVCGDDVARKKPDPEAYHRALAQLGLPARAALALEDSGNGLAAADQAGLACLLTLSHYGSAEPPERFSRARAVVTQLGSGASLVRGPACQGGQITLSYLQDLLEAPQL